MNRENTTSAAAPVGNPLPAGMTLPGGAGCDPNAPVVVTPSYSQTVLTVGPNGEYQTIAAAVAASSNGDLILVQAGTYTNDFANIEARVTIAGVGGMVKGAHNPMRSNRLMQLRVLLQGLAIAIVAILLMMR